jgi:multicomponent Na+:H+ antiporter subunit F
MFEVTMIGILVTMLFSLIRAVKGPSPYDRIMAVNMFSTKTVLLIAVSGFLAGRPDWLDLALVYALVSFSSIIAVLKFSRFGNLAHDDRWYE